MEDRHLDSSDSEKNRCCRSSAAPFFVGLVLALIFGWWVFPEILYSQKQQPVSFSHTVHVEDAGMDCADCHYSREDDTFAGLPTTANCAPCHTDPRGSDPEEERYINEYVTPGKEVKWLVYQMQPDNVFFSHAAHSLETCGQCHMDLTTRELCNMCHIDVAGMDKPPVYKENKLTKYSKGTMKMWQCERCHAHPDHYGVTRSSNACFVCHK